jgi:hypothetical protein
MLTDGTRITGADCITFVGKIPKAVAAKKSDINKDGTVNILDFSIIAQSWLQVAAP